MNHVAKGLRVFGVFALLALAAIAVYILHAFASNSDQTNTASGSDVVFVLNWGGLKSDQEYTVLNSFTSARSLTGDHLDYYCIQITDFSPSGGEKANWMPIPSLDSTAREAVAQALSNGNAEQCFGPGPAHAKELMAYVWSATIHGRYVTAYDVILFDAETRKLLYVSHKT